MTPAKRGGRALLVLIVGLTAIGAPARAQPSRPALPRAPAGGLNSPLSRITPVANGINLVPVEIGLDSANHVRYAMLNAGTVGFTQPFVADIYAGGVRRDTYKHVPMGAQSKVEVVSALARLDSCSTVVVKVVADPQEVVAEAVENDNTASASLTPRCPDLAVTAIKADWQDYNTRYRIQVTVQNQGDGTMRHAAIARAWGGPDGGWTSTLDPTAWPVLQDIDIAPLAPGQSTTFHLSGTYLGTDRVTIKIYLDFHHQIVEKRADNNLGSKQFGPH